MKPRPRFTIYHGYALSLVLHSALILPLVLYGLIPQPDDEPSKLVVVFQGVVAEHQSEQKIQRETVEALRPDEANEVKPQQAANPAPPEDVPPEVPETERALPPPPAPVTAQAANPSPTPDATAQREAQTIDAKQDETDRLRDYVRLLGKSIQGRLAEEGRRATVAVSFAIAEDGHVRPDTLKVIKSSGETRLDLAALRAIRTSSPFAPPPRAMTVTIDVSFDRSR